MRVANQPFNPKLCIEVAAMLKAVSHPQRLQLLCSLVGGPKTVSELESACELSQSQLSQFLLRLKREGLLDSDREGKFVYYRIQDKKILKLIQSLKNIFCNPKGVRV